MGNTSVNFFKCEAVVQEEKRANHMCNFGKRASWEILL